METDLKVIIAIGAVVAISFLVMVWFVFRAEERGPELRPPAGMTCKSGKEPTRHRTIYGAPYWSCS